MSVSPSTGILPSIDSYFIWGFLTFTVFESSPAACDIWLFFVGIKARELIIEILHEWLFQNYLIEVATLLWTHADWSCDNWTTTDWSIHLMDRENG